ALDVDAFDCFVAGMFSLLDAVLGSTMEQVVEDLPVTDEVRAALLSRAGPVGQALALVEAYERADWPRVELLAAAMALEPVEVARRYAEAVAWTGALFSER